MRILDIDMDFFQTDINYWETDRDEFLDDSNILVWENEEIRCFLEEKCGLNCCNKIKGRVVKHHVEAYTFWEEIIQNAGKSISIEITHVDAHSDLAYSMNAKYHSFLNELDMKYKEQLLQGTVFEGQKELIDSGNYLLAAVINGWVSKINYVYHEKLDYLDVTENIVEVTIPNRKFKFNFCDWINEKNIYLETISSLKFEEEEEFDYITVALSPPYVKPEMIQKLEIMKDYIELV